MKIKNRNTLAVIELENGMRIRIDKDSDPRNIQMFRDVKIPEKFKKEV